MTAPDTNDTRTAHEFYRRFPKRLTIAICLCVVGAAYFAAVGSFFGYIPIVGLLMKLFLAWALLLLAFNLLRTVAVLFKPALTVEDDGVKVHNYLIRWNRITDLSPYEYHAGYGIALTVEDGLFSDEQQLGGRASLGRALLKRLVAKLGVIPLPPMRGIGAVSLAALLNATRLRALKSEAE